MSKESDQAVTMLSIIAGAMQWMEIENAIAKVAIKKQIKINYKMALYARENWPIRTNYEWVLTRYAMFKEEITAPDRVDDCTALEICRMAERLATDLHAFYTVGRRSYLVRNILSGIQIVLDHMDPEGRNFKAMEDAGGNMDKLYAILEIKDEQFALIESSINFWRQIK